MAGASDRIPSDRYIDGVDQTSFLLTDEGKSNRDRVFMYIQNTFAAARWEEYKMHRYVAVTDSGGVQDVGGIQNVTIQRTGNPGWLFNLYTDPKERKPQFLRKLWILPFMADVMQSYFATFKKYPAKKPMVGLPGGGQ